MAVTINQADWDKLSDEDRKKIQEIIGKHFKGETVTGGNVGAAQLSNPNCVAACNAAEAAAVEACNALPFPGNLACIAAAHAAGDYCRSRC